MKKFNIKPYKHYVQIQNIYMNGKLYDKAIIELDNKSFDKGIELLESAIQKNPELNLKRQFRHVEIAS